MQGGNSRMPLLPLLYCVWVSLTSETGISEKVTMIEHPPSDAIPPDLGQQKFGWPVLYQEAYRSSVLSVHSRLESVVVAPAMSVD